MNFRVDEIDCTEILMLCFHREIFPTAPLVAYLHGRTCVNIHPGRVKETDLRELKVRFNELLFSTRYSDDVQPIPYIVFQRGIFINKDRTPSVVQHDSDSSLQLVTSLVDRIIFPALISPFYSTFFFGRIEIDDTQQTILN